MIIIYKDIILEKWSLMFLQQLYRNKFQAQIIFLQTQSWKNSLGLYLEPVTIRLDLLTTSFQLVVTLFSWMTPLSFLLKPIMNLLDLLPANFQTTVKSSIHTPDVEITSKDDTLPKRFHAMGSKNWRYPWTPLFTYIQ